MRRRQLGDWQDVLTGPMLDMQNAKISAALRASSQERVSCALARCNEFSNEPLAYFGCTIAKMDEIIAKPGPISLMDKAWCLIRGGNVELPSQPPKRVGLHPAVLIGAGVAALWFLSKRRK